ncbi:MAG: ParB/RepB/Spo0J family partition protein [Pseudomonadota bacterium]
MSRKHSDVFDAVLSGMPEPAEPRGKDRPSARFLKRSTALADRNAGALEEKTLRWVDPSDCRMWARHNRDYALLDPVNCRDLIDGIKAQGRQEFPAIVRATSDGDQPYEVICGARRHFAISWLQANNYPQFKYLVEVRDLSDEEAFRLADIENRDREDISDYERAKDYAEAIALYYGGKQKTMAERLEVSEAWLSRYLQLSRLPKQIVAAFRDITDIRESHARTLKPLLAKPTVRDAVLARAAEIEETQIAAKAGQGDPVEPAKVLSMLKAVTNNEKSRAVAKQYRGPKGDTVTFKRSGRKSTLEFANGISRVDLEAALAAFVVDEFGH